MYTGKFLNSIVHYINLLLLIHVLQNAAHQHTQAMCDSLHEQIAALQRQLDELSQQQSSPHRVTVTHHTSTSHEGSADTTTTTQGATAGAGAEGATTRGDSSSSTTMIFGSLSENLLLTILQRLQELYKEIHDGRAEGTSAARCVWGEGVGERERERVEGGRGGWEREKDVSAV